MTKKIKLAGDSDLHDATLEYKAGAIVINPVDNLLYYSNDVVPAGTPFTIGTTGATWSKIFGSILKDEANSDTFKLSTVDGQLKITKL